MPTYLPTGADGPLGRPSPSAPPAPVQLEGWRCGRCFTAYPLGMPACPTCAPAQRAYVHALRVARGQVPDVSDPDPTPPDPSDTRSVLTGEDPDEVLASDVRRWASDPSRPQPSRDRVVEAYGIGAKRAKRVRELAGVGQGSGVDQ